MPSEPVGEGEFDIVGRLAVLVQAIAFRPGQNFRQAVDRVESQTDGWRNRREMLGLKMTPRLVFPRQLDTVPGNFELLQGIGQLGSPGSWPLLRGSRYQD